MQVVIVLGSANRGSQIQKERVKEREGSEKNKEEVRKRSGVQCIVSGVERDCNL